MSYNGSGTQQVTFADGAEVDAFGRLKSSFPHILLDSQFDFDDLPLLWDTATTGGGSTTYNSNESLIEMDVGTASGDSVVRQTFRYWKYRSGHGIRTTMTMVMNPAKTNLRQRLGFFDDDNGIFLELNNSALRLVKRTSTTGSAVDGPIEQAAWSTDPLDGTGPSGITLDITKAQIFWVDLQWLGVGRVRAGFNIDGQDIIVHEFLHANILDTVYMGSATLPARYEIENTGATGSASTLKQICTSVLWDGGEEDPGFETGVDMGITPYNATTTLTSILALRLKPSHIRAFARINEIGVYNTGSQDIRMVLLHNPTVSGSFTWTDVSSSHVTQVATNNLTVTDEGYVMHAEYALSSTAAKTGIAKDTIDSYLGLAADISGNSDIIVLAVQTDQTTSDVFASLNYKEFF